VCGWPGRKYEITEWVKTIKSWKLKNQIKDRQEENENFAKSIEKNYEGSYGWSIRIFRDKIKDQRGILFECMSGANAQPIFISFTEHDFEIKVKDIIKQKNIKKKV
jgi:hypothetical protein